MQIDPLSQVNLVAPLNAAASPPRTSVTPARIVSAVQQLNQSELLGQDRELRYRRDTKTGRQIIEIVNRGSGDVVDQIPAEALLRLLAEYQQDMGAKAAQAADLYVG